MPYIKPSFRKEKRPDVPRADGAGDLTYQLTVVVDQFLQHEGRSFASLSEAIAALECAKLELYRRVLAPYENDKIRINGDVYECLDTTPPVARKKRK